MKKEIYFKYWGKARKEEEEGAPYHLLPYHCLDVAAVGQVLLSKHYSLKTRLLSLSGFDETAFTKWVVFYLAIHDLGKFSESFQNLRPDLLAKLQNRTSDKDYPHRHDSLGHVLWQSQVRSWVLGVQSGGRRDRVKQGLDYWALAVMGHHGLPPQKVGNDFNFFSAADQAAALAFVQDAAVLMLGDRKTLATPSNADGKKFSWWLSGFAVLCDWLGSNGEIFTFCGEEQPIGDYWQQALKRAEIAVAQAELLPATPAPLKSLQTLFSPYLKEATPLQTLCAELPLKAGPQLFILEDVTGAGKTEAATMLLHRLLVGGAAEGVYFALPTMATANAMYKRMAKVYGQLYEGSLKPSLVLAHGARELSSSFRQSIIATTTSISPEKYGDDTMPASARCSAWLADNRKKALLAEVGVGTIDQSLLAALPSRHQSLRLLGLLGKVLVVDEVHACDAYMNELLCAVLKAHASAGGSAILLSATLPAQQRQKLLNAFNDGAGAAKASIEKTECDAYPLLTHAGLGQLDEIIVATRESVKREVAVERLGDSDAVLNRIEQALEQGLCVCWIRNTVDDAREACEQLQQRLPEGVVDLFHARYAMADRLAIEQRVLEHFGDKSKPGQRRGRVLVATQVVEQSLDLDFDLMVTDLAPIDLIIQRAGRLCRHARDKSGARIEGRDQRGKPLLLIHGPDPCGDIDVGWYKDFFKRAAGVYPNHGQLWLTAKLLLAQGGFSMPTDARKLIEGVYGEKEYPQVLEESAWSAEGDNSAKRGLATLNTLDLSAGYGGGFENGWWEEADTPTRLGEEAVTLYLTRWDGEQLTPWADNVDFPWPNSAVQIRKALISFENNTQVPEVVLEQARQKLPAKGKWGVLVVMEEGVSGEWCGRAVDERKRDRRVRYSLAQGLSVEPVGP